MSASGKSDNLVNKKGLLTFHSSLGKIMFFSLLFFTIIPVMILSIVLYVDGSDGIDEVIHNIIINNSETKSEAISELMLQTSTRIEEMASDQELIDLFNNISHLAPQKQNELIPFLQSPQYNTLVNKIQVKHQLAIDLCHFSNILFIDPNGRILYSAKDNTSLNGSNLITGKYASAAFDPVFFNTLKSNKPILSDLFPFGSQQEYTTMMLKRVISDEKTVGILAFPIPVSQINNITADITGMDKSGEVYLMGPDQILRSSSRFKSADHILQTKINSPVIELCRNNQELTVTEYVNDDGVTKFGTYRQIPALQDLGLEWPLILTIDKSNVDTFSEMMKKHMILIISLIIFFAILIGIVYVEKLLFPVVQLAQWIKNISVGDLTLHKVTPVSAELKNIATGVNDVAITFQNISNVAQAISAGDTSQYLEIRHENDNLSKSINQMKVKLEDAANSRKSQTWIKDGSSGLNEVMRGDKEIDAITKEIITYIVKYLNSQVGALYLFNENDKKLYLTSSYAFTQRKGINNSVQIGEGLIGQCAKEKEIIHISPVPDDYLHITSGLGEAAPKSIMVAPIVFEDVLIGVIEIGSIESFDKQKTEFLHNTLKSIGISLHSAESRSKVRMLLSKTQAQADELRVQQEELKQTNEELQVQQEELRVANEELEEQTQALKKSEQELQAQQEELRVINEELEEKTKSLEVQKKDILDKNTKLEIARENIEHKAKELEISSKYKSEFLANMSHELRTPLNSLLILSSDLAENNKNNLDDDQVESAEIIYKSGNDLLSLINEILDLSKIESGKMSLNIMDISPREFADSMTMQFKHVAGEKKLYFNVNVADNIPQILQTDQQRVEQVLKNLISNAMKFTHEGGITVTIGRPASNVTLSKEGLAPDRAIAFSVQDTGIGIPKNKQMAIFEAFQQADGSTSRKYGGTGLGLSISRELAKLMGGEIQLTSEENKGSCFTLIIPEKIDIEDEEIKDKVEDNRAKNKARFEGRRTIKNHESAKAAASNIKTTGLLPQENVEDDRDHIQPNDQKLLIIEDDYTFAKVVKKQSNEKGFKCIIALSGETGLKLAHQYQPDAIVLDLKLPGIDGMDVLDELKEDSKTRHIPVHMMSAHEETIDALKKGAIGYLMKPAKPDELEQVFDKLEHYIKRKMKDLLLVEDDKNMRRSIKTVIGEGDVNITEVATGKETIEALKNGSFDCLVLDLGLPDMTGFELLKKLDEHENLEVPPVIIYTGKELSKEENELLHKYTNTIIIKGVKSEERLLDETALFLHRIVDNMPQKQKKMITNLHDKDILFTDKKILVVDDDMRNVFALSKILTNRGMKVVKAVNGKMALEMLEKEKGIDLVLLDMMMPEMDGYETTKRLRQMPEFKNLSIIALTAKAMKDDKQKCIDAGANDYLAKPVNVDKLLSLMRVWLYR